MPGPGQYAVPRPVSTGGPAAQTSMPRFVATAPPLLRTPAWSLSTCVWRVYALSPTRPRLQPVPAPVPPGPAVTIAGRPRSRAPETSPGPLDYQQPMSPGREGPAFTIYAR